MAPCISSQLHIQWGRIGSLKSATVGACIPQKLADAINQGSPIVARYQHATGGVPKWTYLVYLLSIFPSAPSGFLVHLVHDVFLACRTVPCTFGAVSNCWMNGSTRAVEREVQGEACLTSNKERPILQSKIGGRSFTSFFSLGLLIVSCSWVSIYFMMVNTSPARRRECQLMSSNAQPWLHVGIA